MITRQQYARAVRGLTEALGRWEPTRLEKNPDSMLVETSVLLWWLCAIDELLAEESATYRMAKAADQAHAELVQGLRHARNKMGHRLADAVVVSNAGRAYPKVYPVVYFELLWVDRATIDAAGGHIRQAQSDAYNNALAGGLVRVTVREAATWLLAQPELQ